MTNPVDISQWRAKPHFEDVVKSKKIKRVIYPERAYIMRDSLYYENMEGMPDPNKVKMEESIQRIEASLSKMSENLGTTVPELKQAMQNVLGSGLPPHLQTALNKKRDQELLKAANDALKQQQEEDAAKKTVFDLLKRNVQRQQGLRAAAAEEAVLRAIETEAAAVQSTGSSPLNVPSSAKVYPMSPTARGTRDPQIQLEPTRRPRGLPRANSPMFLEGSSPLNNEAASSTANRGRGRPGRPKGKGIADRVKERRGSK